MSETRAEFARGWRVVLAASAGVGAGLSLQQYVGSLFVAELEDAFGWTRGDIAKAQGALLVAVFLAPFIGWLMDKIGVRPVALVSAALLGLVYIAFAQMNGEITLYYILFTALVILGAGTGPIGYTRVVNTWFEKGRGLALGLTLMGVSVVAIIAPPVLQALMERYSWRAGYYALAGLSLFIALPLLYIFLHERAAWLQKRGRHEESASATRSAQAGLSLKMVLGRPNLYVLAGSILLVTIALVGVISQLQPLLTDKGLSPQTGALLLSLLGLSVLAGRLIIGRAFDLMWAPIPAAIAMSAPAIGALLLMGDSANLWIAAIAVILVGVAQGAEVDVAAYFIARYFGMRAYATTYAVIGIAFAFGTVIGAITFGQLYDRFGGYDQALIFAAGCFLVGGLLILLMGRYPNYEAEAAPGPAPAPVPATRPA